MLCQLSPSDTIASGHRLVLRSAVPSDRRPNVWHNELTDQVTWWRNAIRTRPAQRRAVSAPTRVPDSAKPIPNGIASEAKASTGNSRSIRCTSLSRSMSGA